MNDIVRIENNKRLSRVGYNGIVWVGGLTADDSSQDIQGQTRQVPAKIDAYLAKAGTSKNRLVSAEIWLKDIERDFEGMNKVWDAWVPADAAPARATGESKLARSPLLIEIIVIAAA